MRIVFLIGTNDVGGAEFVSYHHVLMAYRNGYDVTVLSGTTGRFYDLMVAAGVKVFIVGLSPELKTIEPYVKYCEMVFNCNFFGSMNVAVALKQKYGFWYSWIIHSDILWVCEQVDKYDEHIDVHYAIHKKIVDACVKRGKVNPNKFIVIPNCVDVGSIVGAPGERGKTRNTLGYRHEDFVIGMVSRVAQDKNILGALKILKYLPEGMNPRLLIVGGAAENKQSQDYHRMVLNTIRNDKWLVRRVKITGNLYPDEVYQTIRAIDVGLNCSPSEGLPIALLEMMAAGIPCVMPSVGDIPDVLTNRGIVVPIKGRFAPSEIWCDPNKCYTQDEILRFSKEVKTLGGNLSLRRQLGETAANYVREYRSMEFQEKEFIKFIDMAKSKGQGARSKEKEDRKPETGEGTPDRLEEGFQSLTEEALEYLVSVLMPTVDGNTIWVEKAIMSILEQDYKGGIEFVIVDHNSRLSYSKWVRAFINDIATNAKNVRFIYKAIGKQGIPFSEVLDIGVSLCSGEIIVRMDHDDLAEPTLISRTVGFLKENEQVDLVGVQIRFFGAKGMVTTHPEIVTRELAAKRPGYWFINHPGATMRKKALLEVGGYGHTKQGFAEDFHLWCKFLKSGRIIANLNEVLVNYRCYDKDRPRPEGYMEFLEKEKKELASYPLSNLGPIDDKINTGAK